MDSKISLSWIIILVMLLLVGCFNVTKEQTMSEEVINKGGRNAEKQGEFNIEYCYWIDASRRNVFSTYDNYIQKDLVDAGIAKEEWHISYGDLKELENIVRDYKLGEYNEKVMSEGVMTPMEEFYIIFSIDGEDYLIKGDETIFEGRVKNKENENFCKALEKLEYVFKNQETYENMPKSEGGYD